MAKKAKKWTAKLLSGSLALTLLTGLTACGKTGGGQEVKKSEGGKTDETITFNIYKRGAWPAFPTDGGKGHQIILDTMKKYGITGIDFKVTHIGGDEYFNKLNALAAINDLPDYFSIDMTNLKNFADQKIIMPLEDEISKLPVASKMFREADIKALTYNGHLYALPVAYLPGPINGPNTTGLIIRQDWLDKLGLKMPTTIDEFEKVLDAFTNQDPDGNGKKDTFAYIGTSTTEFDNIFGAYGALPAFWMDDGHGKAILGTQKPGTLEALKKLASWYGKGYIDPDIFNTDGSLADQKLANSNGGIYEGSAFSLDPANPEHAALLKVTPTAKLSPIPPLKGPNGDFGSYEASPGYANINAVRAGMKHVDKLMQFLNWCTDSGPNGGMYLLSVGIEGDTFDLIDNGKKIKMLKSYDDVYALGLGNPVRFLQVVDRRWMTDQAAKGFEVYAPKYTHNLFWGTTDTMMTYPDTCGKLFDRYLQKIVMGDMKPDEGYKQYLKDFDSMGGKTITEEVNKALGK